MGLGSLPFPCKNGELTQGRFEPGTSTASGHFSLLGRNFSQIFWQFISVRVKILSNKNLAASRNINKQKASLPVDVLRPETSLLQLPNIKVQALKPTRDGI